MSQADPLKKCPRGCLFEATHSYCPWHGEPLKSLVGETIGENFVIERVVSAVGGFGVVYYARNAVINMPAAVKVLRPNACYDKGAVRDFLDEAERTFNLLTDCPNTAKVIAVDRKPFPFICMSYVSGGSLSGRLDRARQKVAAARTEAAKRRVRGEEIPWQEAYEMLVGIARALEYAHDKKMVHRDLKPHNVLIDRDVNGKELAKVVDWGIAIARRSTSRVDTEDLDTVAVPTLTLTSEIPEGMEKRASQITVKYAPPEFFRYVMQREKPEERNLKEVFDPRTDIYQFGLVAFELLAGEFPFEKPDAGSSAAERFDHWRQQHCRVDGAAPGRLTRYRSDFSRASRLKSLKRNRMAKVVSRCLEKDPRRRYRNGEELVKALTQEPVWKEVVGFAAAALVMVAVALYFFRSPTFAPPSGVFWDNFAKADGWPERVEPPTIAHDTDPQDLKIDGTVREDVEVNRIWVRSADSFRVAEGENAFVYRTPALWGEGGAVRASLSSWQTAQQAEDGVGTELDTLVEFPDDRTGVLTRDGNRVLVDLSALAEKAQQQWSGVPVDRVFYKIEVERDSKELVVAFFEIRIDPEPPKLSLDSVDLVSARSLANTSYAVDSDAFLGGDSAPRLYVPEDYEDLVLKFVVDEKNLADGSVTAFGGPNNSVDLRPELDGRSIRISLGKALKNIVSPTPSGAEVPISLCVMDRAAETAQDCLPKSLTLVFDSGVDFTLEQEGPLTSSMVPVTLRSDSPEQVDFFLRPAGSAWSDLVKVPTSEGASLTIPAEVMTSSNDNGGAIDVFAVDTRLLYPGLDSAGNDSDESLKGIAAMLLESRTVKIRTDEVQAADFELKLVGLDGALEQKTDESGRTTFFWRAKRKERIPRKLQVVTKGRKDLRLKRTIWKSGGNDTTGEEFTLPDSSSGERKVTVIVSTVAGKEYPVEATFKYEPELRLVDAYRIGAAQASASPAFSETKRYDVRSGRDLVCQADLADEFVREARLNIERLSGSGRPPPTVKGEIVEGQKRASFQFSDELTEGIYKLSYTFKDAFGEPETDGPYYLAVHGDKPKLRLNSIDCKPGGSATAEPIQACYLIVDAEDDSGLTGLTITVDGADGPILLDPTQLEENGSVADGDGRVEALERIEGTSFVRKLTVRIENIVGAGREAKVAVSAMDAATAEGQIFGMRVFKCGPRLQQPIVPGWRGLDWIYVKIDEGRDFYVSKTEIPRWKWNGEGGSSTEADQLPIVGVSPNEIQTWIAAKMPGTYLPTDREWRAVVSSRADFTAWIAEGKVSERGRPTPKFKEFGEALRSVIVGFDNKNEPVVQKRRDYRSEGLLVPVGFLSPAQREFEKSNEELFYGVIHPLGNAAELVIIEGAALEGKSKYRSVGGSVSSSLENCITVRDPLYPGEEAEADPKRGFRLVVYYQETPVKESGESVTREANDEFDKFKSLIQE